MLGLGKRRYACCLLLLPRVSFVSPHVRKRLQHQEIASSSQVAAMYKLRSWILSPSGAAHSNYGAEFQCRDDTEQRHGLAVQPGQTIAPLAQHCAGFLVLGHT